MPTRGGNPPLLPFFLAALDIDVNVIRVSPLLLVVPALLPEPAFIEAFAVS